MFPIRLSRHSLKKSRNVSRASWRVSLIIFGQPQLREFRAAPCESLRPRALQGCARGTRQGRWAAGPLSRWAAGPLSNGAAEQLNRWAAGLLGLGPEAPSNARSQTISSA